MSDIIQPFPDVDPAAITAAGQQFQQAAASLTTAGSTVHAVAGTTAWTSTSARPAWDSTLAARRADIADAVEVTGHVGNVLRTTGAELARLQSDYNSAKFMILLYPDPREGHLIEVGEGVLVPDGRPVDQHALAQYLAQVTKADNAVEDAEYALALCARELTWASAAVTFAPLPSSPPPATVDPNTFTIIPIAPAFGAPSGSVFANGVPVQFPTGRAFETQILRILGISGAAKEFFRPDANGNYSLPRTPSGRLYRGTFPDSMRAGLLEIKSGSSEITMNMPQLRVQRFIAERLNIPWNLIVGRDTVVGSDVEDEVQRLGGGIYRELPGQSTVFRSLQSGALVRLTGGRGVTGRDLQVQQLTPEEAHAVEVAEREAELGEPALLDPETSQPTQQGPTAPYDTQREYGDAWAKADVTPDGDTPLPGAPMDDNPGEPLVNGPVDEPVEPVEPILPIDPEDLIP